MSFLIRAFAVALTSIQFLTFSLSARAEVLNDSRVSFSYNQFTSNGVSENRPVKVTADTQLGTMWVEFFESPLASEKLVRILKVRLSSVSKGCGSTYFFGRSEPVSSHDSLVEILLADHKNFSCSFALPFESSLKVTVKKSTGEVSHFLMSTPKN